MNAASLPRWLLLVAVDTAAQVAFKLAGSGLDVEHGVAGAIASGLHAPWVWVALALYLATFFIWMTILRDAELSRVFPMTAIMAVTTAGAGVALFGESLHAAGLAGIACIVVGVVLLASEA
ncbi:MAG TPA: hypothetical protein VMU47_20470 [Caldimonas sp.]|nr:hypothetical protein [Caldimonas sp.]